MIIIVPYKSTWPAEFERLGHNLRKALGELALRIDHIGSTSIPGQAAKDVIDIQVTVAELSESVERAVSNAGYKRLEYIDRDHTPPESTLANEQWRKSFFKATADSRPVNLHVRIAGRANQRYPLLFRDYLRAHPAVALGYAQTKIALARLYANNVDAYYDVKDPVCDIIIGAAESWASAIGWIAGTSDC